MLLINISSGLISVVRRAKELIRKQRVYLVLLKDILLLNISSVSVIMMAKESSKATRK